MSSMYLRVLLQQCRPGLRYCSSGKSTSARGDVKEHKVDDKIEGHRPMYATRQNYQKNVLEQRFQNADIASGQRPSNWQKRFLVLTKLYKSQQEIPEIVANGTMNRMHDRLRAVFIIVGCFSVFGVFYIFERINAHRISRDRDSGVVVTKM